MKYDIKIKNKVKEIHRAASAWCNYVDGFGNQCAYTDRMLEELDTLCTEFHEIQQLREKEFNKINKKGGK